ncbi:MAG: carboxypeptidase regulatory-like domain-containing protein [Paludibacteraceae bacterium]|nr:carboxypeptidase regulatory-like domain-containing protein [Paludibacteraceae bacterium]
MKTKFTFLSILAVLFIGISIFTISCKKDEVSDHVTYKGKVVYKGTSTPFPDLEVKLTDGTNVSAANKTDEDGKFSFKVDIATINGNYYFLVGDATCIPQKVEIPGFGEKECDLGVIEVEGPSLPIVRTKPMTDITAESAVGGGFVDEDGRLEISARGICYSQSEYPTIEDAHTQDGSGKGEFTSTLKNLERNVTYYARAYATNKKGTSYGEQVKFITEAGVPIVTTDTVINITAHTAKCKAHVESDGGYPVVKRGICYSKKPDPTIDDEITEDGSGLGEYTGSLKNLVENTTYYIRSYATNSTATTYGEQRIITTLDGLAVVKTDKTDNITATSVICYGTVVSDCDIPVTTRGFCYAKTQYPTIDGDHTTTGKGLGSFQATISKLEYGTTYYIRAYATNATETTYGEQLTITTLSGLPTVTTSAVSNIGSIKATCGGSVKDDGTLSVVARGVCYGTTQQPTISDSHTTDGKGKGDFVSQLTDLKDKTTYYVRAYATTDAGTAYGAQQSFKTADGMPTVELTTTKDITAISAICEGKVTGDGGLEVTGRGFCYSTTQYPQVSGSHVAVGAGMGSFSASLTQLTINTTYYVRAYATNKIGTAYSEQTTIKTATGLPIVTTTQPTSTANSITAGGTITSDGGFTISSRGVCYSTTNAQPTISDKKVDSGSGNGTFSTSITELTANTTYYVRAYATNSSGTAYGTAYSIKTKDGSATLTTSQITNITALTATGGVSVTDAGGATLKSCGICWSTTQNPTISNSHVEGGTQLGTYSCNMTELTPNTTYYVRAYATTNVKTIYGNQISFKTTTGLATLTTSLSATTANSITASGDITSNGGYSVSERGICYSTTNAEPTINDLYIANGSGNGTFNVSITNLKANTTYYIRAYATNKIGTSYGDAKTAITKDGSATLTTSQITNITALTATGGVSVTDAGGATLKSCGICWSTTSNPTISNSKVEGGKTIGTYTCNMTGLSPSTTYHVRAYATTDVTVSYGEQKSFTTTSGLPIVLTQSTSTKATSITIIGDVTDNGGYNVKERGFCYSKTNSEPTLTDIKVECGSGNGSFNTTISNLSTSTTYYIRAYATNEIGTSYGKTLSATTQSGAAIVSLGTIANNTISATGSVKVTDAGGATLNSCGICWSTSTNPTIKDNKVEASGKQLNQTYSCTLTGLTSGTTYYARAYATTDITTTYSSATMFTTMVNVTGVVKDESTGKVIPYASVVFKLGNSTMKSTTTNTAGQFEVQLISNSYTVIATATGYCDFSNTIQVGSDPITILMRPLGILSGKVYDDDNMPLANATVSLRSSSGTNFSAVTNSDGLYKIENIPLGQTTRITCTLQKYTLSADIPSLNINSGTNNLDISMKLLYPLECNVSALVFECMNEAQCGTKVTNTFKITNNRQKTVSWSLTGIPTKGITFSPSSGSIPAKSSVTVTATFTYPGPSVSGSVKTTLYNCVFENQKWTHTYLWNWTVSGNIWDNCTTHCYQEVTVLGGNNSIIIPIELFQYVVWN